MEHTVGVVGCGPRGREHAHAVGETPGLLLVGVADVASEARQRAGREFGVPAFDDLQSLIDGVRPEVLTLATPPAQREVLCAAALRSSAGGLRAIVLEKPMAGSLEEARRMVAMCRDAGVMLLVSHQLRFCPEFIALRQAIESSALGPLELLRGACFGNLLNQGPHIFDMIHWLASAGVAPRRAKWVSAQACDDAGMLKRFATAGTPPFEDPGHPAPPWMITTIGFEGGLRAVIETGVMYPRSRRFVDDWLQKRVLALGCDGCAEAQVASGFRITANGQTQEQPATLEDYQRATVAFYAELAHALNGDRAHRCDAAEALAPFEMIIAAQRSAADGALVALPLVEDVARDAAARAAPAMQIGPSAGREAPAAPIELSVIVVTTDHRGHLAACLRAWNRQSYPNDRFEVLVLSDASEPDVEAQAQALLGGRAGAAKDRDRLIRFVTTTETELYHHGAEQARGRWLLFTEPHCEPEVECLKELMEYLEREPVDGACLRSVGANGNRFAAMEDRLYNDGFASWSRPESWQKVILRGFAIRRDAYFDAGGFEFRYRRFAEWALAATLHNAGRRLGYAAGSAVIHHNTTTVRELFDPVWDFTQGECMHRDASDEAWCDRYFGRPAEWSMRRQWDRAAASAMLKAAAQAAAWAARHALRPARDGPSRSTWSRFARSCAAESIRLAPAAAFGLRWPLVRASLRWKWARMRYLLTPGKQAGYRAYHGIWAALVHYARVAYLARHPQQPCAEHAGRTSAVVSPQSGASASIIETKPLQRHELATMSENQLVACHAPECWQGRPFRWTGLLSSIRLHVSPSGAAGRSWRLTLAVLPVRPGGAIAPLALWLNGRRIAESAIERTDERIAFDVEAAAIESDGWQELTICCEPWRAPGDVRTLGLPLPTVTFEPAGDHRLRPIGGRAAGEMAPSASASTIGAPPMTENLVSKG